MGGFSPSHWIIVGVIALLVFGPKRLPEMGKSLGKGMREFKNSVTGKDDDPPAELPVQASAQAEETVSASTKTDS